MQQFIDTSLTFPVVIFSLLMVVVGCYWLAAIAGMLDLHLLDFDGSADIDDNIGLVASGWLMKTGLTGVPITIIITFITLYGWLFSYSTSAVIEQFRAVSLLYYPLTLIQLIAVLIWSLFLTNLTIRPLRRLFSHQTLTTSTHSLVGKIVTIRSGSVTHLRGEAIYEDGGAGMILQVKSADPAIIFQHGDQAIIKTYHPHDHTYTIVDTLPFNGEN